MRVGDLARHFPEVPAPTLIAALSHYESVFPDLPLDAWRRNGSFMEWWHDGVRIAFAPRQKCASIHFQTHDATELYRHMGGTHRSGRVTINMPYNEPVDDERIRFVIARMLDHDGG